MRFLCLHGRGTDAEVRGPGVDHAFWRDSDLTAVLQEPDRYDPPLEAPTGGSLLSPLTPVAAGIRGALGDEYEFVFINGNVAAKPLAGPFPQRSSSAVVVTYAVTGMTLDTEFGKERHGFWPIQGGDEEQFRRTYQDLRGFIQTYGPFSGLMGFSEGASVAATILIEDLRRHSQSLGIRCAIFFCGVPPLHLDLERTGRIRRMERTVDGVLLRIPTAHVWSKGGDLHPDMGKDLMDLCDESTREEVMHQLGHDVPGSRSNESWPETMRAIERTIERARNYEG
jgi:hypothetical protein